MVARGSGPPRRHERGDPLRILASTEAAIAEAAAAILRSELVGMPTETVYGVAADASNPTAVERTFAAKGRPADNPLIVHLGSVSDVLRVAEGMSPSGLRLAEAFWPGPLTLVLPARADLPRVTTGGLDTVAVRVPAHPVAQALLSAADRPLSAPSANLFMGLSPTRAQDINELLGAQLALVLDGGPCSVGLESTVVDVSTSEIRLLRHGRISLAQLEAVLGHSISEGATDRRSPGMYPRHYAPRTPLRLADDLEDHEVGIKVHGSASPDQIILPSDPIGYGAGLYAALHALDRLGRDEIVVVRPPLTPEWAAVWDRLSRAVG